MKRAALVAAALLVALVAYADSPLISGGGAPVKNANIQTNTETTNFVDAGIVESPAFRSSTASPPIGNYLCAAGNGSYCLYNPNNWGIAGNVGTTFSAYSGGTLAQTWASTGVTIPVPFNATGSSAALGNVTCSSTGAGATLTNYCGVTSTNAMFTLFGNKTDAAGVSSNNISNNVSLTRGMDRYAATFYSDFNSTVASRVATNGTYLNSAAVGTAASGTGVTAVYSGADPYWLHKVTVTNAALTAAASTDITLAVTPANSRIIRVVADVTQVFTGGSLSAMTVQCGNSAGGTQYLLANSVFTAQNVWGDVAAEVGAGLLTATWADFGTASAGTNGAITVQCRFTCTGANCSAATQGSVTFYVEGVTYF